jgi:hypothetical protein
MPEGNISDAPQRTPIHTFFVAARAAVGTVAVALWAVLGTLWTIFVWYHQEFIVPSTAPVNLTTDVTLEEVGFGGQANAQSTSELEAIQISVTANNVSGRNVYFLSNYWDAWAGKVEFQTKVEDNKLWLQDANKIQDLQEKSGEFHYVTSGKYYKISKFERVAWGNIFPSKYFLYPKETVSASVVFYVPRGSYDLAHVEIHIPTIGKENSAEQTFLIDQETVTPKYVKIDSHGNRTEVVKQADIDALHIQETQSRKQLSLWRSEVQLPAKATLSKVPRP